MSKDSANYYQYNKERLQKKLVKYIKVFLKKKKKKTNNLDVNDTKISQRMKIKSFLNIQKMSQNENKRLTITIRNYFHLEKLDFFRRPWVFFSGLD